MKRRDLIKRRIRMLHNNVERMRKHCYEIYGTLDEDMLAEMKEIAVFMKMLDEVDKGIDKLRGDIIG